MSLVSDYREKLNLALHGEEGGQRFFAYCELVCQPVSFLVFLAIPVVAVLMRQGVAVPGWLTGAVFPILVAAAVGYLTNWLAIEMLFKPYTECRVFPMNPFWRQGLVPKNKKELARKLGETVARELLPEDRLADELCGMIGQFTDDPQLVDKLRGTVQQQIHDHKGEIAARLIPKIEAELDKELERNLTAETIMELWDRYIGPKLASDDVKEAIMAMLTTAVERRIPDIIECLKPGLLEKIQEYCMSIPMFGPVLAAKAEMFVDRILSVEMLAKGIRDCLGKPKAKAMFKEELGTFSDMLRGYVKEQVDRDDPSGLVEQIRSELRRMSHEWLDEHLAQVIEDTVQSNDLWSWLSEALVACRPQLEELVRTSCVPAIRSKLNIQGRIQEAVDSQDMAQFHAMVNSVVAQHLGAIQVLGFILGGIAGTLMLLV